MQLSKVLIREGAYARTLGIISVAVVHAVMFYRSEMWVMTLHIGRVLGGFRHRVDRRLTGRQLCRGRYCGWLYHPLEDTIVEAVLMKLETYVSRHQNTFAQFILIRPIMELCQVSERRLVSRLAKQWWEQDGLDL